MLMSSGVAVCSVLAEATERKRAGNGYMSCQLATFGRGGKPRHCCLAAID